MCQVDDVLRNLKALFAVGDPFAEEKANETWLNQFKINLAESILQKETVSEKYFGSLPEDQRTWNSCTRNSRKMNYK